MHNMYCTAGSDSRCLRGRGSKGKKKGTTCKRGGGGDFIMFSPLEGGP